MPVQPTYTFDFTGSSSGDPTLTFTEGDLTLTVSTGLHNLGETTFYETSPLLTRTADGLGMLNPYGDLEAGIDGHGKLEVAVFSFSHLVHVTEVVLIPLGTRFNTTGADTQFVVWSDDLSAIEPGRFIVPGGNTLDFYADVFGFGADRKFDHYRIASMTVELSDGPPPGFEPDLLPGASISGRVFYDADGDGIDEGDVGSFGNSIRLLDASNNLVLITTTDADGGYSFVNLTPGDYRVRIDIGPDETFSPANVGSDETDSDIITVWSNLGRGRTDLISVGVEQDVKDVDAGVIGAGAPPPPPPPPPTGSVTGAMFIDADGSLTQTASDTAGAGYAVQILTAAGAVVAATTTASNGSYSFAGLAAGDYRVVFTAESDRDYVTPGQGNSAIDSDVTSAANGVGSTSVFTLASGQALADIDAGLVPTASPPPPPPPPPPTGNGGTIAGRVFLDANGNGIDDGDAGSGSILVRLLDSTKHFITSTRTAADGSYGFAGLAAGDYHIRVDIADTFNFTAPNQGADDTIDTDIVTFSDRFNRGETEMIHVQTDELVHDVDAGYWAGAAGDGIIFI
ncbi:hypothetical protein HKCCE3408_16040 [Rhodobacterales bacterium HKCCE3408]|nr:hypothetical protein [Rhodobacterales bacterium HKCCE3408]